MRSCGSTWPTQPWFNQVLEILVDHPVILPVTGNLLTLPGTDVHHPLKDSLVVSVDGMSIVRLQFQKRGISHQAASILLASWKSGTKKQYKTFYKRWFQYCGEKSVDPFCTTVETVVEFLAYLFHQGLGFSAINTA